MSLSKAKRTLIQCDFDGTITTEDVSFIILDKFASGDWRPLLKEYRAGKISVGHLNTEAFAMVNADKQDLLKAISGRIKIRDGFHELVTYCRKRNCHIVIVSNGLDFYIKAILNEIGLGDIPVSAAQTSFLPEGLQVRYVGPDGLCLQDGFKETHVASFLRNGYQIIYVGNGISDFPAAKRCHHVFATGELLACCKETNLECNAFTDFNTIIKTLEIL